MKNRRLLNLLSRQRQARHVQGRGDNTIELYDVIVADRRRGRLVGGVSPQAFAKALSA
jgi:hypothetical protein